MDKIKVKDILNIICLLLIMVCSMTLSSVIVASATNVTSTYNVTIAALPMAADVRVGNSYVYNITVNNAGNARGNYTLNVTDSDVTNFTGSVLGNIAMEINNGSSMETALVVNAKVGVTVGTVDITTVNVRSVENPTYTGSVQVRTTVIANTTFDHNNTGGKKCADCHADVHKGLIGKLQQSGQISTSQQGIAQKMIGSGISNMATTNVTGNITLMTSMGQDWFQQGIYGPNGNSALGGDQSWGWTFFDENRSSGYIIPQENVTQKNNIYALLLDDGNNSSPITGAQVTAGVTYWVYDGTNYTSYVNSVQLNEDPSHQGFYSGSFYFYGGTPYGPTDGNMSDGCYGCHYTMFHGKDTVSGYFPGKYAVTVVANANGKIATKDTSFDVTPWGCEDCHGSGSQHRSSSADHHIVSGTDMDSACYACHGLNELSGMDDAGNPHQNTAHRNINCTDCHTDKSLDKQTFNGVTFVSGGINNAGTPQYAHSTISLSKGNHSSVTCEACHNNLTLPVPQGGYKPDNYAINGDVNSYNPSFSAIQSFQDYYVVNVGPGGSLNISLNWDGAARLGFYIYPPGFNPRNFTNPPYYDGSTFGAKPEIYANNAPASGEWIVQIHGYDLLNDPSAWTWYGTLQPPINYTISSTFPIQKKELPTVPECSNCHNSGGVGKTYTKYEIPGWNNPGFAHADTNGDGKLDVQCRMCHDSIHNITIKSCQNCHTSAPEKHPIQDPSFSQYTPTQCLGCHGDPHNVSIQGSGDCVSCHDVNVGAVPGALINASAMNTTDSIHKDLNKDAVLVATSNPANKKCWACHGNGSEPTGHPANFKNPYTCVDCHAGNNTNFAPSDTILKVSQHYWNGANITTTGVSSCYQCHNKSEMMIAANDPDQGLGDINGGINGGNNSTSHYGKKRTDLVGIKDTVSYCTYCHNSTTLPFGTFSDIFSDINNTNIQNHSAYATSPKCQDCHNSGRIHDSNLTFNPLVLPTSTICLGCHGPGGTASIKDKSKHNNTVDCSVCHLDTGKGIHPIKYRNSSGMLTLNKTDGIKCTDCHNSGLYGAPIIGKVQHSTNVNNGSLWNAGRPSIFWDKNIPSSPCEYCHGNTKHNISAIGRPDTFKGTNVANTFGTWCGGCHYQANSQYSNMTSIMNLLGVGVPPEITKHSSYGNYVTASDGTSYFNHSLGTYGDTECVRCHSTGTPANVTTLMHNVSVGGTSCMGCHPTPNSTMLGRHINVSTSEGVGVLSDNDCKVCHFGVQTLDKMLPGYANHSNTYFCQDCHTTAGTGPVKPTDPTLIKDGTKHGAGNCEECHIAGDNEQRPLSDAYKYHTNGPKGPANGKNCYSCHYRSDGIGDSPNSATVGLNSPPFNAPGEDHECDLCHDVYGNTVRPTLAANGVDGCPDCHGGSSVHNVASTSHHIATQITTSGVSVTPASAPAGTVVNVGATTSGGFVQIAKAQYRVMDSSGTVQIRPWTNMTASDGMFNSRSEATTGAIDTTGLLGTYKIQVKGMASGAIGGTGHNAGLMYYPDNGVWTSVTPATTATLTVTTPIFNNTWAGWTNLGGLTSVTPDIATFNGKLYASVRGFTSTYLWTNSMGIDGVWAGWTQVPMGSLPGALVGAGPSIYTFNNKLYLMATGTDNAIYINSMDTTGTWSGWTNLGGLTSVTPDIAAFDGKLYASVRGFTSTYLWTNSMDISGVWAGWTQVPMGSFPGALVGAGPSIYTFNNKLYLMATGTDNAIYINSMDTTGTWSGWTNLGGLTSVTPDIAAFDGKLYASVRGFTSTYLWTNSMDISGVWAGWTQVPMGSFPGALVGAGPSIYTFNNKLYLMATGTDNAIYINNLS